jgi:hypothetical protein
VSASTSAARRARSSVTHPLVLLGALSFIVILAEGAAMDWTAVLLHESVGASPAAARRQRQPPSPYS